MEPNNQSNPWGDYSQGGVYKVGGQDIAEQSKDIADSWSISPEQSEAIKELSVQLAYDMAPVTGEARAVMYADKAAQRAAEAFKNGKYFEGAGHTAEQYAEMLGAIPIGGVALGATTDVTRWGKGMYRVLRSPQIPMHRPKSITDPVLEIRDKSLPDAIDMSRTERHIIPDTSKGADGQFIGAPRGMNTQMELKQMREEFDALVDDGIEGSDWYQRARKGAKLLRPASKADRAEHSGQLSVLSAQADPSPNLGWTIEANNEFAAGNNVFMVRTQKQADKIVDAHTGVKPPGEHYDEILGLKTHNYEQSLNPDKAFPTTGTNDIWHGRSFGYKMDDGSEFDRGFSPQEHRFLDHETVLAVDRANARNLGGRSDWTAPEIQAAAWISSKGRGLFAKNPEKYGNDLQEAMKEAAKTYPDYYPKFTAQATHEAIPSPAAMKTGHLRDLEHAPYDEKKAFTEEASWIDPETNKDIMFDEMRMLQTDPKKGVGEWEGEYNPVEVSKPLVSLTDSPAGKKVGETSEGLLNVGTGTKAYMDAQAGAGWHKAFNLGTTGTKKTSSGGYKINLDRPLTIKEMQQLSKVAGKRGFGVMDSGEGVSLSNFGANTKGQNLLESLDSGSSPIGKNIKEVEDEVDGEKQLQKIFTEEKAGALKEIKFKFAQKPSKKELKYLKDLKNGLIDGNKYKIQTKGKLGKDITITQIKSPGDEMDKTLKEEYWTLDRVPRGLQDDLDKIFPGGEGKLSRIESDLTEFDFSEVGSGEATRKLQEVMEGKPAVLARLDNSKKIREQAGKIAKRNEDFAAKNNDTLRDDIQLSLRLIENGGFTALFEALKRGAILPAIAGPMIMYGLRQEQGQTEGLLSPET